MSQVRCKCLMGGRRVPGAVIPRQVPSLSHRIKRSPVVSRPCHPLRQQRPGSQAFRLPSLPGSRGSSLLHLLRQASRVSPPFSQASRAFSLVAGQQRRPDMDSCNRLAEAQLPVGSRSLLRNRRVFLTTTLMMTSLSESRLCGVFRVLPEDAVGPWRMLALCTRCRLPLKRFCADSRCTAQREMGHGLWIFCPGGVCRRPFCLLDSLVCWNRGVLQYLALSFFIYFKKGFTS